MWTYLRDCAISTLLFVLAILFLNSMSFLWKAHYGSFGIQHIKMNMKHLHVKFILKIEIHDIVEWQKSFSVGKISKCKMHLNSFSLRERFSLWRFFLWSFFAQIFQWKISFKAFTQRFKLDEIFQAFMNDYVHFQNWILLWLGTYFGAVRKRRLKKWISPQLQSEFSLCLKSESVFFVIYPPIQRGY